LSRHHDRHIHRVVKGNRAKIFRPHNSTRYFPRADIFCNRMRHNHRADLAATRAYARANHIARE
jgi:hypothetical protein